MDRCQDQAGGVPHFISAVAFGDTPRSHEPAGLGWGRFADRYLLSALGHGAEIVRTQAGFNICNCGAPRRRMRLTRRSRTGRLRRSLGLETQRSVVLEEIQLCRVTQLITTIARPSTSRRRVSCGMGNTAARRACKPEEERAGPAERNAGERNGSAVANDTDDSDRRERAIS